ncbi:hypothetical protein GCM10010329_29780 [Streptomyces spiroverticillatus]|uniref:DUF998 domain-containing protein n=1 Tax=Streptomyces finlayi TaxID=67296 RepID=A0A918WW42_9ACTN|nr:DUF998 domain-containing protein [Streptomyces finlayi]GHA05407.1 hypothetical protein GCM10010329_29780 [Streptomyces spiroverticillatus]GHC89279.1 hypothetical protein GCM10010334_22190 [Streptomyces finlayi]
MGGDTSAARTDGRHVRWRGRLTTGGLVGAALLYNSWLLETAVPTRLDPRHSYVSELYAADQATRPLFTAFEFGSAALLVLAALAWRRQGGGPGWWALVGFGAASTADVLLPMDCAPSLEPGCNAVHPLHTVTSGLVHFFLFASMAWLAWWAKHHPEQGGWRTVGRWGLPLTGAAMLAALATVGPLLEHPGWHGVPQRLHLLFVGGWLLLLAYGVHAGGSVRAAHPVRATTAPLLRGGNRFPRGGSGTLPG